MKTIKSDFFVDMIELTKPEYEYTASGFLRVKGAIATVGTMEYLTKDGDIYYQYVPPGTLFDKDHLTSIAGLPVTLMHPDEDVTPKNFKKYAVGSVGDRVFAKYDEGLVEVTFTIGDVEAIEKINEGINQLSMGYWAELEESDKPNTYIQTKRIGNHIALVDKARGGDHLKLNLDASIVTKLSKPIGELQQWRTLSVTA